MKLFPIHKYKITGTSMSPTFETGQNILVNHLSYIITRPKIGDIIAIKDPRDGKTIIKRIFEIKKNKYFVIGDNKKHSTDSRTFGWIAKKDIIGKVVFVKSIKGTMGIKGIKGEH